MSEVSNKTLATLLVVAIVVSLGGTFISLNRLSSLGGIVALTGAAGGTGYVNVTITEFVTITTPEDRIWFGEGAVTSAADAELWSNGTFKGWINTTVYLPEKVDGVGDFIVIQNDGNVHINLTVRTDKNASQYLCDNLIGDTQAGCNATAAYRFWTVENETGSCGSAHDTGSSGSPVDFSGPTDFNTSQPVEQNVCGKLLSADTNDTVKLYTYLNIPQEVVGSKTDTLTFTSSSSDDQT